MRVQRPAAHVHRAPDRAALGDQPGPRPSWRTPCRSSRAPISSTTRRRRTCSRPSSRRRPADRARLPPPRLFEPLGIENPTWGTSPQGISPGGYGLSVRTEDIAKFGQLYLQKGKWHGKQLVPAAWVEAATARQTSNGSNPEERLGPGLRLPVLALPPRRLPRRRGVRPVLHRPARAGRRRSPSPAACATCRPS